MILVNLGTPDGPDTAAVRRYLREFLSDPRVIDSHPVARWLLVNLVIAPFRAPKSARAYRSIWGEGDEGSPLLHYGRELERTVAARLGPGYAVELAMRYCSPSIADALAALDAKNANKIIVLPLFPQYSEAATGSAIARVRELIDREDRLDVLGDFYDAAGFIDAQAALARPALDAADADYVLMSFHGLPERQIKHSDPIGGGHCLAATDCCSAGEARSGGCYRAQCCATAEALAASLSLAPDTWSISFQSRLGRTPWIQPFTDFELPRLRETGVERLAILCPAFVADCLETVEEIGIRAVQKWRELGGTSLTLVPCVNAHPLFVDWIAREVEGRSGG